jgi:HEPN domain-containing protein
LPGNKEIAQAFIKEAEADVRSAKLLLSGKEYSQTIVHCQHAVEKILKAALALRNIIITKQHVVSPDFVAVFSDLGEVNQIGLAVSALEKEGTRTEYPFFGRPDLPVWIPSEQYNEADAKDAIEKAEYVYQTVMAFLRQKYDF